MTSFRLGILTALTATGFMASVSICMAEVLITQDEAKLPPPKGAVAVASRGITRGPKIELIAGAADVHSPLHLQIKFESFGGTQIVPDSVKVTYLRTPSVDLTSRIKPFIQATGIDMPNAELPPGQHDVRVDVQDSAGHVSTSSFVFTIAP
jgi:hypothetical protein